MLHERFAEIGNGAESAELAKVIAIPTVVCDVRPDLAEEMRGMVFLAKGGNGWWMKRWSGGRISR
jgi:hypothetical protein